MNSKRDKTPYWHVEAGAYFRLLFSPGYTIVDITLLLAGVICAIGAGIPFPLLAILFGQLIDNVNSASCKSETSSSNASLSDAVEQKVLYVIYVTIASWCFIYIHVSCWTMFGERLVRRLREKYLRSLLRQELAFFDNCPAGHVSSTLSTDLEQIQTGTSEKVGICIASISYFVAAYVVAFTKVPRLAGILVSLVPAYLLMSLGGSYFIKRSTTRVSAQLSSVTSIVSESLSKLGVVHAFGAETRIRQQLTKHLMIARKESIKKSIAAAVQLGLLYFIAYSTNALAYWQGSRVIASAVDSNGDTNVGAVYTVIFLLIDASYLISQVAPFMQIFGTATSAADRLDEILRRQSQIDGTNRQQGQILESVKGHIRFEGVRFTYSSRPDSEVLKGVSLDIPANKHTAIVGHSGSGKSTIAALVTRLYDRNSGAIRLDGIDVQDINVRYLRGCIGVVSQDALLLDRPILENIAHGLINSPNLASDEERIITDGSIARFCEHVATGDSWNSALASESSALQTVVQRCINAAKVADAHDFITRLVDGFATDVGSAGNRLSGGQKQRIALARAVVREPRILLLDEATSALDSKTEQSVYSGLQQASKGRTTISIVHRLSTVKEADNIIVLRSGQIVEQGRHQELMAADGVYASMIRLQNVSQDDSQETATEDIVLTKHSGRNSIITAGLEKSNVETSQSHDPSGTSDLKSDPEKSKKDEVPQPVRTSHQQRGVWSSIRGILSLCRPQVLYALFAFTAAIIVGGSFSGEAVIFGHTVSSLSTCNSSADIRKAGHFWGLLYFVLALIEFSANFGMSLFFGLISENTLYKIKVLLFDSLMSQDMEWHESEGRTPASLLSHLTTDATALSGLTGVILGTFFSIIVSTVAGIVLSHIVAWRIAIVLLGCIPVLLGAGIMKLRTLAIFHEKHAAAFSKATGYAAEAVNSIRTIIVYSLEDEALAVYHRALQRPYEEMVRTTLWSNIWFASSYSASSLVYALAYWWGSKNVIEGYYNQTQFFIVLPAMLFSAQKCGQLFALAPDFSKSHVSAAKILDLLAASKSQNIDNAQHEDRADDFDEKEKNLEAGPHQPGSPAPPQSSGARVTFSNVRFSYPTRPGIEVLRGLDIEIEPCQFCALVGPSGAGKSTTIALLERFYQPTTGCVKIDGRDISQYHGTEFRDSIALVPQDNVMFEGTIRFNLVLGARTGHDVSDEEIEEACRLANIHDTIAAMPDGYNTYTGPNGSRLSEGQKQRLSIARALLRKPRLLLLDESTSALDAENEKLFQDTLSKIRRGITVVAVAHRLHTIEKADCIFVIEDGRCMAKGTHKELLQNSETYRTNALHQVLDV